MQSRLLALAAAIGLLAVVNAGVSAQNVFTVNSTLGDDPDINPGDNICSTGQLNADSGAECTLRAAIQETNTVAGADTIKFAIPAASDPGCDSGTGVCTIGLSFVLPAIDDQLFIDGESQAGATCGSGFSTRDLKIVLSGGDTLATGLDLIAGSDTSRVHGMVVNGFGTDGIRSGSAANWFTCNFVGTDVDGMAAPRLRFTIC